MQLTLSEDEVEDRIRRELLTATMKSSFLRPLNTVQSKYALLGQRMEEPTSTLSRTTTNCLPPSAVVHLFHKHTAHKNICICLFGINMATAIPRKNVSSSLHAPYLSFWLLSLDPR